VGGRHIAGVRLALLKVTSGLRIYAEVAFGGSSRMLYVGYAWDDGKVCPQQLSGD